MIADYNMRKHGLFGWYQKTTYQKAIMFLWLNTVWYFGFGLFFFFFFFFFFIVRAYCIFNIIFFVSRIFKKKNSNPLDWEVCFIDKPLTFSYFLKYFSLMFGFSLCLLSFGFSKNKLVLKVLAVSTIWRMNCTGYRINKVNQFVLKI